ncbi:hypothetical protein BH10ACT2_BH10ACT2_21340 [soil metagenome]
MNISLPLYNDRPLLVRLQSEWQLLRERPTVLRRAHGWSLGVPFDNLDQLIAATDYWATPAARAAATANSDDGVHGNGNEVVRRLLVAARSDQVAARVVLQRLLPGLISRSRCWGPRRAGGSNEAFDELVSASWTVIREFPFERRPRHLVANLLRDSEYSAFRRTSRRMLVHEFTEPRSLDTAIEYQAEIEPILELADIIAEARTHTLTDHDLELLTLLANGASSAEAAKQLHISERTLRYHRDAAVGRLRDAVLAA